VRGADDLTLYTAAERPDLDERADELTGEFWPEYNLHGDVSNVLWPLLDERFAEFQFVLADATDEVVAQGHMLPCRWDGTLEDLPDGIDAAMTQACGAGAPAPDAACALAAEIRPAHQGRGLAAEMLRAMAAICRRHGLRELIAPVRPNLKSRYPLTPIERYALWTRRDGLPFDPWMRVHARLGGRILRPAPRSMAITGTVAEWESWTALALPESGEYVFPDGLAPLRVDREADRGRYWEPNVWMAHTVRRD
jgi:GNAT superfamily N-acetyltransferase